MKSKWSAASGILASLNRLNKRKLRNLQPTLRFENPSQGYMVKLP